MAIYHLDVDNNAGQENDDEPVEVDDDNDVSDGEDYVTVLKNLSEKWLMVQLTHQVSAAAANSFWDSAVQSIPNLMECKKRSSVKKNVPGFIHLRQKLYNDCPEVHMKFVYLNKSTQEVEVVHASKSPDRRYPKSTHVKLYEEAHVKVKYSFFQFLSI